MPSETIVTVAEVLGGFVVGWLIAKIASRSIHRHKWSKWGDPYTTNWVRMNLENGTDHKYVRGFQSRKCETCGLIERAAIGVVEYDNGEEGPDEVEVKPGDPPTKVEPIADKPA